MSCSELLGSVEDGGGPLAVSPSSGLILYTRLIPQADLVMIENFR